MLNADPAGNAPADSDPAHNPAADHERLLVLLAYGLFLVAIPVGGITALIGAAIAHVRRGHAGGTVWESHYRNLIVLFWAMLLAWAAAIALVFNWLAAALLYFLWPGWPHLFWFGLPTMAAAIPVLTLCGLGFVLWCFYRLVRGFLRALDDRPYR